MFLKPFRVKSNSKIKSSERKKFVEQLQKDLALTDEEVLSVVGKSEVCKQKIFTHNEDHVFVYICKNQPMVIEIDGLRIPTVYMLWLLPQLLPTFITHDPVIKRLQNGADLMLPGVLPTGEPGPRMYGSLPKGQACAINTTSNRSPIAVGYTAMSCDDMYMSAGRGKAVIVTHVLGDELWNSGDKSLPPMLAWLKPQEVDDSEESDEDGDEEKDEGTDEPSPLGAEANLKEAGDDVEEEEKVEMLPDELLMQCFLHALRLSVKDRDLPLHANVFYGKHVQSFVPKDQNLNIKKTVFKKFSAFLNYVSEEGLISVSNEKDGVQILTSINRGHDRLRQMTVFLTQPVQEVVEESTKGERLTYVAPQIEEVWFIVDKVLPFFELNGHKKGETMSSGDVKSLLTNYVKDKKLHDDEDRNYVILDPLLTRVLFRNASAVRERLPWRDLSSCLLSQMTEGHLMTFPGEDPISKRSKVPLMKLTVETRGGKKQVTLISGAEYFRVDLAEMARRIQRERACSASVTEDKRGQIVIQAQGDQRAYICKLLTETYQLPKKYVEGFEEATKKKKKKR